MMRALRNSTKTIMIIVAAAFVIGFIFLQLGVNVGGKSSPKLTALGSVNGVEITYNMFNETRSRLLMQIRQSKGSISDEDYVKVEEDVWDEIIYQMLLEQEITRMGIKVTDEEVLEEMKSNPPEFLKANEAFLTDGQFDQAKYLQALYSPQNDVFVLELEKWYRSVLPIQKLQDYLFSTIRVTDSQIRMEYRSRNEKVRVGYLTFNPSKLIQDDVIKISDEEISGYYQNNKNDYKVDKQAVLEYVQFPVLPNSEDTLSAMAVIDEIKVLIADGTPFEEIAVDYSQDPGSAEKGGDLGWVPRGRMVKPVEDAAFALEKGKISGVVQSQFGFHIIKLEDRRTSDVGEEVWIRHILIKLEASYLTTGEINDRATEIRDDLARAEDFYGLADSLGLEIKVTDPFSRGGYVREIGPTSVPASFAFTHSVGDISNVFRLGETFLFCRVKEVIPKGFKDIEHVRDQIEQKLRNDKKMAEAKKIAEKAADRVRETGDLQSIAEEFGVEYLETPEFTRRNVMPVIGRYNAFTGTAFGLETGEISGLIELPQNLYILKVLDKVEIDESSFEEARVQLKKEMENYQINSTMGTWYEALKKEAKIEDNRDLFFQQS